MQVELIKPKIAGDGMEIVAQSSSRPEIGRGRSGIVYLQDDESGGKLACKVFDSRGLTKAVQWFTLGAPNPYVWNVDAAECAKIRRNILKLLVPVWMDGDVDVADASAVVLNKEEMTFELQTRLVRGWAAHLHHPLSDEFDDEAENLWRRMMPALRAHLQDAGFDGLLWQAGAGNPVALNNFLYEPNDEEAETTNTESSDGRWVWIDLESGVPAIFPISPKVLLNYSLAHWWRLGRPMFDDVEITRLKDYLKANAKELKLSLGVKNYESVVSDAERLGKHQVKWKSIGRLQSSIQYRVARGDIDQSQADYYSKHRLRWLFREWVRGLLSSLKALKGGFLSVWKRLKRLDLKSLVHVCWKFLISQKYREAFVHGYLDRSINQWTKRGQLTNEHANILREQIGSPNSSVYITDFGIHIAIKPAVKATQYWVLPALFAFGLLGGKTVAILILTGGAIGRSAYTLGRMLQSAANGHEKPWIALGVGLLPVVGNLAYPAQMIYSAGDKDQKLARFMMDDGFARIGRHFPIWGGQDTWTEHALNRIPRNLNRYLRKMGKRRAFHRKPG
ncbi:hypothetical protein [Sulfitobacter sp. JL08]|uniref:hypothetical protein n=1 Tax=Sulfitobacter sp. JL08 TaxID=2070369 RepID=UPI0013B45A46|nr:hypothetical protein [Sulfitobacter sp. JL08]